MTKNKTFEHWIYDHAHTIDSLDPQATLDHFEPLSEMIGKARVVAIGESAHYVREFYLLRHSLFRFLAERCGFTVYVMEAPYTEAQITDKWVQGGPGTVAEVAAAGMAFSMGRRREMYHHLAWMRAHNHKADQPLHFAGGGLPAFGGSPLLALKEVAAFLQQADPTAMPLLNQAIDVVSSYHGPTTYYALQRYTALDVSTQDALTAMLARLWSRMEIMGHGLQTQQHREALQHLRGAWYLDHFQRQVAGRGIPDEHPHALYDAFMADTVLQLLENGPSDTRVVLAYHNMHIQKTPLFSNGAIAALPAGGYLLDQALGDDYYAIAVTSNSGRTAQMRFNPDNPLGFVVNDCPLPPLEDDAVESVFTGATTPLIAELRAARPAIEDAESFQRMRMEDSFMDVPVFDAFDAIINIPQTSFSEETENHK